MASLMDEYPMPGMEVDPREMEKAKYLALMRMGLGMAGREPIGTAAGHGLATYATMEENARRNADQRMQELKAKMTYAMGMKKAEEEKALQQGTQAIANDVTIEEVQKYAKYAQYYASKNMPEKAKIAADIFDKLRTKYNSKSETLKTPDGKIVTVQLSETGEPKVLPYGPAEKLHFANSQTQAGIGLNPFTGAKESAGVDQGISPSDQQRIALDRARLGVEQQRLADARANGPILETSEGPVRVNRNNTTTQLTSATGEPIRPKLSETTKTTIAENNVAIYGMREVLDWTEKRPQSFGARNYLGHEIQQRKDRGGIAARAAVGALGSKKIHDLSGANVTAAESPRLKPHIPAVTDDAKTIRIMTRRLLKETELMQQELSRGRPLKEVINAPSLPLESESKITGLTKTGYESVHKAAEALREQLKKDDEERALMQRGGR